jgi:guanylate kinase
LYLGKVSYQNFWHTGAEPGNFDIIIVNDNLEAAYEELKQFLLPIINELRID